MNGNERDVFVFDLDSTLANVKHREHFITGDVKEWNSFYLACGGDTPIQPAVHILKILQAAGATIWIFTGRSTICKAETMKWLKEQNIEPDLVMMRKQGDFRPDEIVKREMMEKAGGYNRVAAIFEDRNRVVNMWRKQGFTCYQVADGDF